MACIVGSQCDRSQRMEGGGRKQVLLLCALRGALVGSQLKAFQDGALLGQYFLRSQCGGGGLWRRCRCGHSGSLALSEVGCERPGLPGGHHCASVVY